MIHNPCFRSFKKSILLLFLLMGTGLSIYGQGWSHTFSIVESGLDTFRNDIVSIPVFYDGRSTPIGVKYRQNNESIVIVKVAAGQIGAADLHHPNGSGSPISYYPKSSIMLSADSTVILVERFNHFTDEYDLYATCYNSADTLTFAELLWHQPVFVDQNFPVYGAAIQRTMDGQLISLGWVESGDSINGNELLLVKSDAGGQAIWVETFTSPGNDRAVQLLTASDGGYWILKNVQADLNLPDVELWLMKVDVNGLLEWEINLSNNDVAYDMTRTSDGGLAITGTNAAQDLFVLKIDNLGSEIWRQDYTTADKQMTGFGIIEDLQNNIVVAGQQTFYTTGEEDPLLAKLTENGTPLWERNLGRTGRKEGLLDIALTPSGKYRVGGFRQYSSGGEKYFGYMAQTDTFGIIKGGLVQGNVFHDFDMDCLDNSGELNLENWKVQVTNDSLNYYANTDADGNYSIALDAPSGSSTDYLVSVVPPSNYWVACANDIPVTVGYLDSLTVDFPMQGLVECPFMEAQISNTNLRPCESANIHIQYCNTGTAMAENAFIKLTLDENLTYNSASITPSVINGQTLTFPMGDMDLMTCEDLVVTVDVVCDSIEIGDVVCIEASLFPDSICMVPNQSWSGALMQLSYTCDNDSVQYTIQNVGTGISVQALDYIIIEDAVLRVEDNIDNLIPNETEVPAALPINNSVYHLIAQQEPGAPGPEWVSLGAMGCTTGSMESLLNQFPQFAGGPFHLTYCPTIVGSFDPNDKQAIPAGFGEEHFLLPNTDLDYTIRFQNTGTDTAFRVIILDTLPRVLDPATFIAGPSSHPYEFRFLDEGVLSFSFHNIILPDSTTNFDESQGFVSFKIAQDRDLAPGTLIENNAAIYFDFNNPIITNTAFHTISSLIEIVSVSVSEASPDLKMKVVPNPIRDGAWITFEGVESSSPLTLQLFDIGGRLVKQAKGNQEGIWLERSGLSSGMYFFTVLTDGAWLAGGKVVVE